MAMMADRTAGLQVIQNLSRPGLNTRKVGGCELHGMELNHRFPVMSRVN